MVIHLKTAHDGTGIVKSSFNCRLQNEVFMSAIIQLEHVTKTFPARRGSRDLRGRGGFGDWLRGRKEEHFTALRDISLEVAAGESLGIIGRNGSGKSTLLSIIAGVTLPTEGFARVHGRVASLLELGAGFNPVLTGRENIYLNAGLLGMRHAQVDAVYDEIVRFSGIGAFMDQPVETYSSGMYVRIAFSVAAFVNPDIFLADEVLAVGDAEFQRKCRAKIGELREQGKTIVFVSHDLGIVNTLCERIVLLDKGGMIQRETPQKTITYYLRQVGRDKGIHTFSEGAQEAVHCDGHISVFHNQEEVSAPGGFRMELASLGQRHASTDADWEVVEGGPAGCTLAGRMMRLPLLLLWRLRFEQGGFVWRIEMEAERDCTLTEITAQLFLPDAYTRWIYGEVSGDFPQITPADTEWNVVVAQEMKTPVTAVLPEDATPLPPLVFHLHRENPFFSLFWANTEYMNHGRVLCATAHFPETDHTFTKGMHPLIEITMDMNVSRDEVEKRVSVDRTLDCGRLSARFEKGRIRLSWDGNELTTYLHVYATMLIAQLWNDSQNLFWGDVEALPGGIRLRGDSRRFPFSQEWEITGGVNAISLRISLDVREELEVQEYHTSMVLPAHYRRWKTAYEADDFPAYDSAQSNWIHCNRRYDTGTFIAAESASLPAVFIRTDGTAPPVRMTALNTSFAEHARVLQALCPSGPGPMRFAPGRHAYFSGTIGVETAAPDAPLD